MSLVAFKAKQHKQQTNKRGHDDTVNDRHTLPDTYDPLNREHGFTLDVAASAENAKCPKFFDLAANGLLQSWRGEIVWCNPPYSDLESWVSKARYEVWFGGCLKVVMLLPGNRTEQPWWQKYIEPVRDRGMGCRTQFLARRRQFGTPNNPKGNYKSSPPFSSVVVIFEPREAV